MVPNFSDPLTSEVAVCLAFLVIVDKMVDQVSIVSVHSFFNILKLSGIDKLFRMVDDTSMPYVLFAGVENLCLMFVYVCFILCLQSDWFCGLT